VQQKYNTNENYGSRSNLLRQESGDNPFLKQLSNSRGKESLHNYSSLDQKGFTDKYRVLTDRLDTNTNSHASEANLHGSNRNHSIKSLSQNKGNSSSANVQNYLSIAPQAQVNHLRLQKENYMIRDRDVNSNNSSNGYLLRQQDQTHSNILKKTYFYKRKQNISFITNAVNRGDQTSSN
jgi:hypothetical protein